MTGLGDGERARLAAHLLWLLNEPRTATQLKRLVNTVPPDRRNELAQMLVCVAGADANVSKKEIALLTRIYEMLGLDQRLVYSHIHGRPTRLDNSTPLTRLSSGASATPRRGPVPSGTRSALRSACSPTAQSTPSTKPR